MRVKSCWHIVARQKKTPSAFEKPSRFSPPSREGFFLVVAVPQHPQRIFRFCHILRRADVIPQAVVGLAEQAALGQGLIVNHV
jgi:hypothetical protein